MSAVPGEFIVIAVDGPAASGKSSVARAVAMRYGFVHVNTGAMYRAVTWLALKRGIDLSDCEGIKRAVAASSPDVCAVDGHGRFILDGTNADDVAQLPEVAANVSAVARCPEVRRLLVGYQQHYARLGDVVMEGRDIGSVVFPSTPWKYFIDASAEVRQQRRAREGVPDVILERDRVDSTRAHSPLRIADGAKVIDSTEMTLEEVVDAVCRDLTARGLSDALSRRA